MKKILLAGGTGALGHALAPHLASQHRPSFLIAREPSHDHG